MTERYRNNFLKEVEANVEEGGWVKMCMQCGVCSGSCPLGPYWDHPPQEIFMMIRANKRDEVLSSTSMWMCTSCYNCIARCPRGLPITHIMHGLANYAHWLDVAPEDQITRRFAKKFWDNLAQKGRVNELKLGLALYFINGFSEGIQTALKMKDIGLGLQKTKRLNPLEILGGHGVKGSSDLKKILNKARDIEDKKREENRM
uniref:Quinone-modifying oxidoreductase subunit QmoC n=1 Tax=Candidatus Kentrum sp. TUN TaxID=2126343 RepID=A0A450ZKZ4_9GAMM|nr:MAG: quinone-modifying oxidoreductase subunit QmoC [Candidatus Kentron sp. TUN]VFK51346.1 MAG: quinone-modifying oxidoreductase subunit QmoC [Candidatus Kentron sp. TUN]VFK54473.1 MAG: quinone-modifying oxidoreductase subunit QmoC [Candidatus Kentron sp. TUN]